VGRRSFRLLTQPKPIKVIAVVVLLPSMFFSAVAAGVLLVGVQLHTHPNTRKDKRDGVPLMGGSPVLSVVVVVCVVWFVLGVVVVVCVGWCCCCVCWRWGGWACSSLQNPHPHPTSNVHHPLSTPTTYTIHTHPN
jgi:UDP-N-acetylmuramyl pentapeptide phosphotransferase/UDP-N-acetylglucosamine-1-phosphate transferase